MKLPDRHAAVLNAQFCFDKVGHRRSLAMQIFKHLPPERMTSEQRRQEVASLLAAALVRLRSSTPTQPMDVFTESQFELGFSGDQRVHTTSLNERKKESE